MVLPIPRLVEVGDWVHYILPDGEHRPALVVARWSEDCVNLTVFTDWHNDTLMEENVAAFGADQIDSGLVWATSVLQDEEQMNPSTWHWPENNNV